MEYKVDTSKTRQIAEEIGNLSGTLASARSTIKDIRSSCAISGSARQALAARMQELENSLGKEEKSVKVLSTGLESISALYENTEKNVGSNISLAAIDLPSMAGIFEKAAEGPYMTDNNGGFPKKPDMSEAWAGAAAAVAASTPLIGGGAVSWLDNIWAGNKVKTAHYLKNTESTMGLSVSGDAGKDIISSIESKLKSEYDKSVDSSRHTEKKEYSNTIVEGEEKTGRVFGNLNYKKSTGVREYYGSYEEGNNYANASAKYSYTMENYKLYEGTDSDSGIDINLNRVEYGLDLDFDLQKGNAYVDAGVEHDWISAGFTVGDAQEGFGSGSVHVKAGLGANVNAGVRDGVITFEAGAALGIGADVKLEINYKNAWNAICDTIENPIPFFPW